MLTIRLRFGELWISDGSGIHKTEICIYRCTGKPLGFLRRHATTFSMASKGLLYKTFVRLILQHVRDSPKVGVKERLERAQILGTKFVTGN